MESDLHIHSRTHTHTHYLCTLKRLLPSSDPTTDVQKLLIITFDESSTLETQYVFPETLRFLSFPTLTLRYGRMTNKR